MDASLVGGLANAFVGAYSAHVSNQTADYVNGVKSNIRAGNNVTIDRLNERNSAITALQRWTQSVRNSRVYESIANNQEVLTTNFNRTRDARTRANFSASIAQAEEAGRFTAAAAASGITGSVVDVINSAAAVRNNIQKQARIATENQIGYDENKKEFDTRLALLDNLDNGLIFDNKVMYDYGTNTDTQKNVISAALGNIGIKNLTAIAGSFSGSDTPTLQGSASAYTPAESSLGAKFAFSDAGVSNNFSLGTL